MAAHIELPALDPTPSTPATFSRPILARAAARRPRLRRPRLHRLDVDGRGREDWSPPDEGGRARDPRRRRPGAALAGSDRRVHRHSRRRWRAGAFRRRSSTRRSSAFCAPRRRSACTSSARSISTRCRRQSAGARTRRSAQEAVERVDHAGQGRSQPGAADGSARRASPVPVGPRLSGRAGRSRRRAGRSFRS